MNKNEKEKTTAPVESKADDKKSIIILAVVGAVVVLGLAGVIFLPKLMGPNYDESYKVGTELYDKLNSIYGDSSSECGKFIEAFPRVKETPEAMDEMAKGCEAELAEARDLTDKLGKTSGVKQDDELRDLFDKYAEAAGKTSPKDIDGEMNAYQKLYDFMYEFSNIEMDELTDNDVENMVKSLREADNEMLVELADGVESRMKDILKIYNQASNANSYSSYSSSYSDLRNKVDDLQDWVFDKAEALDEDMKMFNDDALQATHDTFNDFYEKLTDLYYKD